MAFDHVDYGLIPEHMREAMKLYLELGIIEDDFLDALLSNDLKETFRTGDHINLAFLNAWLGFLVMKVPAACWGSPEKVKAWKENRQKLYPQN